MGEHYKGRCRAGRRNKGHASAEVGSKFTLTDNIYITRVVGDDTVSVLVSFGQTGSGPLDGFAPEP